jgi:drug/metabolite transporter (DMT)-like permease
MHDRHAILGMGLMLLAVGCFTVFDAIMKHLATRYDILLLVWVRYILQAAFVLTLTPFLGPARVFPTTQTGLNALRSLFLTGATVLVVVSFGYLPMAQTYAISFSTPLIATGLAIPVLAEPATLRQWACILAGFAGVLTAMQPGGGWHGAILLPLGMAACNATYQVLTRLGGRRDSPYSMLFHVSIWGAILTSVALPWTWQRLSPSGLAWLLAAGVSGTLAQLLMTQALCLAPTAMVSPVAYSQLFWALAIGFFAFGEQPTATTLFGAAIVAISGILLVSSRRQMG